jgi:hypothetical protein
MRSLTSAKHSSTEIVAKARQWLVEQYEDEDIADVGLEEVLLDDSVWKITIGFSRKRVYPNDSLKIFAIPRDSYEKTLKVVSISDDTGEVVSMRDRLTD